MPVAGPRLDRRAVSAIAMCACAALLAACGGSKASSGGKASTGRQSTAAQTGQGATGAAGTQTAGGSTETAPGVVRAAAGAVTATMHAGTHKPRVGAHWPISFAVRASGRPAKAEVEYEYLFGGAVVAHRSHYGFTGAFHDVFRWPASAVGYPLTFRAVIKSEGATLNLDYAVQVVR